MIDNKEKCESENRANLRRIREILRDLNDLGTLLNNLNDLTYICTDAKNETTELISKLREIERELKIVVFDEENPEA